MKSFTIAPPLLALLTILTAGLAACTNSHDVGSSENPLKIAMTPGKDSQVLVDNGNKLKEYLEKDLGLHAEISVPANYMAVIEALGSKRSDMAILNTMGYLIAHKKFNAYAIFTLTDHGRTTYKGQFVARVDGPKTLQDLQGKKIAYVDPVSASGYMLPAHQLAAMHVTPKETVFAGRHDSVISMVYQKQVDAGATFWLPEEGGRPYDARRLVETQYPDVMDKIKIIGYTEELPNEAIVVRADLDTKLLARIKLSLLKWVQGEGHVVMKDLYGCDGLIPATDASYDPARKILEF